MPKKLAFLAFGLVFLCGCGASSGSSSIERQETSTQENCAVAEAAEDSGVYGFTAAGDPGGNSDSATNGSYDAGSDVRYFIFDRKTDQIYSDNGTELVYEQYCDATYYSTDDEAGEWVESVIADIERDYSSNSKNLAKYAQEIIDLNGLEDFYSFSNYQELGIARHDTRVVSLISMSSVYSGGAHPGSVQTACNLDLQALQLLTLEDVIYEEQAQTLNQLVAEAVREKFVFLEDYGLYDGYETTIANSMNYGNMTAYWYFNDVGLVIFYNQYELAPYAAGIIKVELPYEELNGILREQYFPTDCDGLSGDLVLRSDWEGCSKIPITIEEDGERILVGVEGEICQIQMSEIFWLEGQPVLQHMLFSADSLSQQDVLEIIGGFDDEERSFAIEFTDGAGETTVYYVHPGELSDEP